MPCAHHPSPLPLHWGHVHFMEGVFLSFPFSHDPLIPGGAWCFYFLLIPLGSSITRECMYEEKQAVLGRLDIWFKEDLEEMCGSAG